MRIYTDEILEKELVATYKGDSTCYQGDNQYRIISIPILSDFIKSLLVCNISRN